MKKVIYSLPLLAISINSYSQTQLIHPQNRVNLNVFMTGLNYSREFPISTNSSLEGSLGIGTLYYVNKFDVQFNANVSLDYKYYYNIYKRSKNERNISGNSASFVGATGFSHLFPLNKISRFDNKKFQVGGAIFWGIRQQIKNTGIQLNFLAGPSISGKEFSDKPISLYVRTGVSYVF